MVVNEIDSNMNEEEVVYVDGVRMGRREDYRRMVDYNERLAPPI